MKQDVSSVSFLQGCLYSITFGYLQAGAMLGDAFLHQLPHAFGMQWV